MKYYYYRTHQSELPKDDYKLHITPNGVSLEYRDGRSLLTGLVPKKLFPKQEKLKPIDISSIHRFIKFKNYKLGKIFDKKSFDKAKSQYYKGKKS